MTNSIKTARTQLCSTASERSRCFISYMSVIQTRRNWDPKGPQLGPRHAHDGHICAMAADVFNCIRDVPPETDRPADHS